jgi:rhodanese-related sulfurtransferase
MLVTALLLVGCNRAARTSDKDLQFVAPTDGMQLVQGRSRLLGLGSPRTGTWVDPRTEREFLEGHIPGAVHLPYQNVSTDSGRLRAYDILVVYGNDYNDLKAEGMSKRLLELGFKEVYTLQGGLRAWQDEGNVLGVGAEDEGD